MSTTKKTPKQVAQQKIDDGIFARLPISLLVARKDKGNGPIMSGNRLAVFATLASFGNYDKETKTIVDVYPTKAQLMALTGLSYTGVKKALSELKALGLLTNRNRVGLNANYVLHPHKYDEQVTQAISDYDQGRLDAVESRVNPVTWSDTSGHPWSDTSGHPWSDTSDPLLDPPHQNHTNETNDTNSRAVEEEEEESTQEYSCSSSRVEASTVSQEQVAAEQGLPEEQRTLAPDGLPLAKVAQLIDRRWYYASGNTVFNSNTGL